MIFAEKNTTTGRRYPHMSAAIARHIVEELSSVDPQGQQYRIAAIIDEALSIGKAMQPITDRATPVTSPRDFLLEDPAIAEAVANGMEILLGEIDMVAKMKEFAWAWFTRNDLRHHLLMHPDKAAVTRACLHFLGDDAQRWWEERNKSGNPADLDDF